MSYTETHFGKLRKVKARKIYEGGVELFVEDGTTPTFEELKEYIKNIEL
jgi:hypothetical protein